MSLVKQWMTDILLEITNQEMTKVAKEVFQYEKGILFFTSPVIMALKSYLTSQIVDQILAIPQTKTVFGQPFFP